jgi:hypothetical protein
LVKENGQNQQFSTSPTSETTTATIKPQPNQSLHEMAFPESSTENLAWGFFALYTFIFVLANGLFFYTQFFKKDGRNKVILISKIFYAFMAAFSLGKKEKWSNNKPPTNSILHT